MSGRRTTNMTLTQNGVITEEAMLAYLNGTLTPEDTAKFEHLINEDPFAHEALEGLQASNALHLKTTFKELSQSIAQRSGTEQQVSSINLSAITRYAVAAVLIGLLVGLGFLVTNYINSQSKQLAMETVQESDANAPEARPFMEADSLPLADSASQNNLSLFKQDTLSEDASKLIPQEIALAEVDKKEEPKVEPVAKKAEATPLEKIQDEKKKVALLAKEKSQKSAANSVSTASEGASAIAPSATAVRAKSDDMNATTLAAKTKGNAKEEIASDGDGNMDAAMQSFNDHNYKAASKQFDKILNTEPDNKDALYFQSVSEYINGNSKGALKGFDKLLDQNSKHIEGSKYYKSQILLKKGKKEEARILLEELSRSNGAFKQRALEKLDELK